MLTVPLGDCTAAAGIKQRLQLLLLCSKVRPGKLGALAAAQPRWLQSDAFPRDLLSLPASIAILGKITLTFCFLSHPLSIFCD